MSKPDPLARKRIKLIKPHRHAGRDYLPEQCLELPEGKAEWLISVGAAEAAPMPAAPAAAVTPKTKEQ